jgi:hypothetical protein
MLTASLFFLVPFFCFGQAPHNKAVAHGSQSQIAGTWRGNSECVLKNSPCHNEINVYRFSEIAERPGWFSGTGSKVVDGKEIAMGTLEWNYDAERHTLKGESPGGAFRLIVDGTKMEGSLTLPDNTGYHRIHLEKEN